MIVIGADHRGYKLKEEVKRFLEEKQIEYKDVGTNSEERTDFPIMAASACEAIQNKEADCGILICGSGLGMSMVANKYKGIRCAMCYNEETAKEAKAHHNINVLALPADVLNISEAVKVIRVCLATEFLKGRYSERLQMIKDIEDKNMK